MTPPGVPPVPSLRLCLSGKDELRGWLDGVVEDMKGLKKLGHPGPGGGGQELDRKVVVEKTKSYLAAIGRAIEKVGGRGGR